MALSTDKDVVLIASASATGTVEISWDFSPTEIQLRERTYKVGSTATFVRRPIPDTQLSMGSYTQTLTPGDVYEVRAFKRDFPVDIVSDSQAREAMLDEVVIHALLTQTSLQTDFNEKVGGTFYRYSIATGSAPTHAIMEIGAARSSTDAAGFRTMADPMMTVTSFTPATMHNLTTDNLAMLAEERARLTDARFALIRVSDGFGNWQQVERQFRTLERKLTIDFQTIDVQSLGEAPSETEAEMRFQLEAWNFDGQSWSVFESFVFANHNATLSPFSVRNFVLNPVTVIGPRPVGKQVAGLALHVQEFDPWPFEDEHANSMVFGKPTVIRVEPGENNENKPLNLVLRAEQQYDPFDTEQEIVVDANITVTVEHV